MMLGHVVPNIQDIGCTYHMPCRVRDVCACIATKSIDATKNTALIGAHKHLRRAIQDTYFRSHNNNVLALRSLPNLRDM